MAFRPPWRGGNRGRGRGRGRGWVNPNQEQFFGHDRFNSNHNWGRGRGNWNAEHHHQMDSDSTDQCSRYQYDLCNNLKRKGNSMYTDNRHESERLPNHHNNRGSPREYQKRREDSSYDRHDNRSQSYGKRHAAERYTSFSRRNFQRRSRSPQNRRRSRSPNYSSRSEHSGRSRSSNSSVDYKDLSPKKRKVSHGEKERNNMKNEPDLETVSDNTVSGSSDYDSPYKQTTPKSKPFGKSVRKDENSPVGRFNKIETVKRRKFFDTKKYNSPLKPGLNWSSSNKRHLRELSESVNRHCPATENEEVPHSDSRDTETGNCVNRNARTSNPYVWIKNVEVVDNNNKKSSNVMKLHSENEDSCAGGIKTNESAQHITVCADKSGDKNRNAEPGMDPQSVCQIKPSSVCQIKPLTINSSEPPSFRTEKLSVKYNKGKSSTSSENDNVNESTSSKSRYSMQISPTEELETQKFNFPEKFDDEKKSVTYRNSVKRMDGHKKVTSLENDSNKVVNQTNLSNIENHEQTGYINANNVKCTKQTNGNSISETNISKVDECKKSNEGNMLKSSKELDYRAVMESLKHAGKKVPKSQSIVSLVSDHFYKMILQGDKKSSTEVTARVSDVKNPSSKLKRSASFVETSISEGIQGQPPGITAMAEDKTASFKPASASRLRRQSAPTNGYNSNIVEPNEIRSTQGSKCNFQELSPDNDLKSRCEDSSSAHNDTAASSSSKNAFTLKDVNNEDTLITNTLVESNPKGKMNELTKKARHQSEDLSNKTFTKFSDVCKTSMHNEKRRKLSEAEDQLENVSGRNRATKPVIKDCVLGPNKRHLSEPLGQYCVKSDEIKIEKSKDKIRHTSEHMSTRNTHTTFKDAMLKQSTHKYVDGFQSKQNSVNIGMFKQFDETPGKVQAASVKDHNVDEMKIIASNISENISSANNIRKHSDNIVSKHRSVDVGLNRQLSETIVNVQVECKKDRTVHESKTRHFSDNAVHVETSVNVQVESKKEHNVQEYKTRHSSDNAIHGDKSINTWDNKKISRPLNEVTSEPCKGIEVDKLKIKVKHRSGGKSSKVDTVANSKHQSDVSVNVKENGHILGQGRSAQVKTAKESKVDKMKEPNESSKRNNKSTYTSSSKQSYRKLSETSDQEKSNCEQESKVDALKMKLKYVSGDTAANQCLNLHSSKQTRECDQPKIDSYERPHDKLESKMDKMRRHKWGEFIALGGQSKVTSPSATVGKSTPTCSEKDLVTEDKEPIFNECSKASSIKKADSINLLEKEVATLEKVSEEVKEKEAHRDKIECMNKIEKDERTGVCQKKRLFNKNARRVSLLKSFNILPPVKVVNKSVLSTNDSMKKPSSKSPVKKANLHLKKMLKNPPSAQLLNSHVKNARKNTEKGPMKDRNIFEKLSTKKVDSEEKVMPAKEQQSDKADINDKSGRAVLIKRKENTLLNTKPRNIFGIYETKKEFEEQKVTLHAVKESQRRLVVNKMKEVETKDNVLMYSNRENSKTCVLNTDSNADKLCLKYVAPLTEDVPLYSEKVKDQDTLVNKEELMPVLKSQGETCDSFDKPNVGVGSHVSMTGIIPVNDDSHRVRHKDVEKPRPELLIAPGDEETNPNNASSIDLGDGNQERMDASQPGILQRYDQEETFSAFVDNPLSEMSEHEQAGSSANHESELQIDVSESNTITDIHNAVLDSDEEIDDYILPIDINMHTPAPESPMFTARTLENEDSDVARELEFGSVDINDFKGNSDSKVNLDVSGNQLEIVAFPVSTDGDDSYEDDHKKELDEKIEVKCEDLKQDMASPRLNLIEKSKTLQRTPQRFSERVIDMSAFSDNEDYSDIVSNIDQRESKEVIVPERLSNIGDIDLTLSDEELEKSSVDITPTRNKQKQETSTSSADSNPGKWIKKAKQSRLKLPKKRNMESKSLGDLITPNNDRKRRIAANAVDIVSCVPKMPDSLNVLSPNTVFRNGFPVRHRKVLQDATDQHTIAHLDPKRLYDKSLRGKCLRCDGCHTYFTPLSFSVHHHMSSVLQKFDYDKSIETEFEVVDPSLIFWNELADTIFTDFKTFCQELKRGNRQPEPPEPNSQLKELLKTKVDDTAVIKLKDNVLGEPTETHTEGSDRQLGSGEQVSTQGPVTNSVNKHGNIPHNTGNVEELQQLHQCNVGQIIDQQHIQTNKCISQVQLQSSVGELTKRDNVPHGIPRSAAHTSSVMYTSSSHQNSTQTVTVPQSSVILNDGTSSHVSRKGIVSRGHTVHHGAPSLQPVLLPGYLGQHLYDAQPNHQMPHQEQNNYCLERTAVQPIAFMDQSHPVDDTTNILGRPNQGYTANAASSGHVPTFDNNWQQPLPNNAYSGQPNQGTTMPPMMNPLTASFLPAPLSSQYGRIQHQLPQHIDSFAEQCHKNSINFTTANSCVYHIQNETDYYSTVGIRTECISPALEDIDNTKGQDTNRTLKGPSKTLSNSASQSAVLTAKAPDEVESPKRTCSMPFSHQITTLNKSAPSVSSDSNIDRRSPKEIVQNFTSNVSPNPNDVCGTETVGTDSRVNDTEMDQKESPSVMSENRHSMYTEETAKATQSTVQGATVRPEIENGLKGLCQLLNINTSDEGLNLLLLARKIHMLGLSRMDESVARAELREKDQEQMRALEERVKQLEQQAQDKSSS